VLSFTFFLIAMFYASVGFGGGSSYLALLVLFDFPYLILPIIALICNVVVVSGNCFHYLKAGQVETRLLLPPAMASVPMAYIGGQLTIEKNLFVTILVISLLASGVRLLLNFQNYGDNHQTYRSLPIVYGGCIGASLGLLAGIIGIGGGIFLAPVLYGFRAGPPIKIAAAASAFILLNSIAGLLGQWSKVNVLEILLTYWYLPVMVFIGGQIGNILSIKFIPTKIIALMTAILILSVALRLGWSIWLS